jgi:hypothetical protein
LRLLIDRLREGQFRRRALHPAIRRHQRGRANP